MRSTWRVCEEIMSGSRATVSTAMWFNPTQHTMFADTDTLRTCGALTIAVDRVVGSLAERSSNQGATFMDVETIDQEYQQLEQESSLVGQAIQNLAAKLQSAGSAGNTQANDWVLDLKSIALQIQQEQLQMQALLQALHGFTVNTLQQSPPPTAPAMQSMPAAAPSPHGGVLSRFMGGNFGQAMTQGVGLGAGFGLADSVINSIFH